jgi:hypothetical protein
MPSKTPGSGAEPQQRSGQPTDSAEEPKFKVDGQRRPPIHHDLFVALNRLSLDKLHLCRAHLRFAG